MANSNFSEKKMFHPNIKMKLQDTYDSGYIRAKNLDFKNSNYLKFLNLKLGTVKVLTRVSRSKLFVQMRLQ